jgi:acetylornithine deacetylase
VTDDVLSLHRALVGIPSVSKSESEVMTYASDWLARNGLEVFWIGRNVVAKTSGDVRLLLNSHLDTVPPTAEWTRDPFVAEVSDGKVYGLGSNDAKGAVAAMMACMARCCDTPGLALLLVVDEETGGEGAEIAWPCLRDEHGWRPEGVIVGEPTELQIGVGQRGLLVLELAVSGTPCHAANAADMGVENPVFVLAENLLRLPHLKLPGGTNLATPTVLQGSRARNQVAGEVSAILDIRTLPGQSHEEIIDFLQRELSCEVRVSSRRLQPFRCDPQARIVEAAQSVVKGAKPFESRTMSDQVFFNGENAIKMGPGVSARSHTADEFILEAEVMHGADTYTAIAKEFLR